MTDIVSNYLKCRRKLHRFTLTRSRSGISRSGLYQTHLFGFVFKDEQVYMLFSVDKLYRKDDQLIILFCRAFYKVRHHVLPVLQQIFSSILIL